MKIESKPLDNNNGFVRWSAFEAKIIQAEKAVALLREAQEEGFVNGQDEVIRNLEGIVEFARSQGLVNGNRS